MEFWRKAFQTTIDSYYKGDLSAGLEACERLLSVVGLPPEFELQTRRNLAFYAPKLHEMAKATKSWSIEVPVRSGWTAFNPSITQAPDGFRMVVRSSNYHYDGSVTAIAVIDPNSVIRTENYLVDFDSALGIRGIELIDDAKFRSETPAFPVLGFEDCRLFTHRGSVWANSAVRDRSDSGICQTALIRIESASITDLVLLSDGKSRHEKNWMPVAAQDDTPLLFVYSCFPTVVLKYDEAQRTAISDIIQPAPFMSRRFSGGTQVIPFQKGWLCLAHEAVNLADGHRLYTHRWVFFDHDWNLSRVSNPFIFQELGVEFAAGLAQRGDELIISYGLWDREAWLAIVPVAEVLPLLASPFDQEEAEAAVRETPVMVRVAAAVDRNPFLGDGMVAPRLAAEGETAEPATGLIAPSFRPAAAYLLAGPPALPANVDFVRVDEADVGPIFTHPQDAVIGEALRTNKTWGQDEGRFMRSILRPGMNAIDVGANIGYFTLHMARDVGPRGRVLAVEADPEFFQILRVNVNINGLNNVELLPVAAYREPALITVTRDPTNHGASGIVSISPDWKSTPVQAIRLDDVLDPDVPISFIKIDIEGVDHVAIEGLTQTIRRWQPTLLVELNPGKTECFGHTPNDVFAEYRELGLEITLLGGDAIRLQRESGMDLTELLRNNLIVTPAIEAELIERTRQIHYVNVILRPSAPRVTGADRPRVLFQ